MKKNRLPQGLGGGCRARVVELLASSPPLSVSALAKALRLSYMGVKSQCTKLEKLGYLASTRQHRARGRPELIYRLTPKGRSLFPQGGVDLALSFLEHAARLGGAQLPEKILYAHFQAKGEEYAAAIHSSDLLSRAAELVELRTAEGCFTRLETNEIPRLIESHSPLHRLFQKYPEARKFEIAALSKGLGVPVYREDGQAGETIFFLAAPVEVKATSEHPPAQPPPPPKVPEDTPAPRNSEFLSHPAHSSSPNNNLPSPQAEPEQIELFALSGE